MSEVGRGEKKRREVNGLKKVMGGGKEKIVTEKRLNGE